MATDTCTVRIRARVNWPRLSHMKQHALAVLRRAPRGQRPAILSRFATRIAEECIQFEVKP